MSFSSLEDHEAFLKSLHKSKTLRIAVKTCLRSAASTSIFLFSLLEAMFFKKGTKVFNNVKWSSVAKSPEFQNWVDNFASESALFRQKQIQEFSKLNSIFAANLKNSAEFEKEDMHSISAEIIKRSTDPKQVVSGLRDLAELVGRVEHVEDGFQKQKIQRKMTNLQSRIDNLQSNIPS